MKKLFNDYYLSIKEKLNLERNSLLFEGILLVLISTIILIFDLKPSALTILYLFPISLIALSIKELVYADKYKELENKRWMSIIIFGLVYLLFTFYLIINPLKNTYEFIITLSSIMIFKNLTKLITIKNKCLYNYMNIIVISLISALSIIFNNYIVNNLYLYFILIYLIYGIKKLIIYFILKKEQ